MHRRVFAAVFLVVCLATAAPAISAPRCDDPGNTVVDRIVRALKKIFTPTILDLNDPIPPKP
jgi:hypothetical protein